MPRNVRNYWLELSVDGKATRVETGPQSATGGFALTVLMRDSGGIARALTVRGMATSTGELFMDVEGLGDSFAEPKVSTNTTDPARPHIRIQAKR